MADRQGSFRIGNSIILREALILPVTDTHMHIQSNDIAPLPIMYGMLNYKISKTLHEKTGRELENKINFIDLSYLRESTKKITRVASGGPILCEFANGNIEISVDNALKEILGSAASIITTAWTVFGIVFGITHPVGRLTIEALKGSVQQFVDSQIINPPGSQKRSLLTDMTASLTQLAKDYGKIARQNSFFVAGLYKDDVIAESILGINSRVGIEPHALSPMEQREGVIDDTDAADAGLADREKLVDDRTSREEKNLFPVVSGHYYGLNIGSYLVPSFSMSVIHGMELMFAHYWGAYGIPIYIPYRGKLYYIADNLVNPGNHREKWYNIYDTNNLSIRMFLERRRRPVSLANQEVLDNTRLGNGVKYTHFLKEAPASEMWQLEDFVKHMDYTVAAVVRYPLEYLPFYHVDPRRFFAPWDAISRYNDFYICGSNGAFEKANSEEIKRNVIGGTDSFESFKYRMDIKEVKSNLIHKANGEWRKGLFWGVKMYAALGYPPYLCVTSEAKKAFRCLEEGDYGGLLEFYRFCADHEVPITCHGSPQGMTIADPGTYLKEYLKDHSDTEYGPMTSSFPVDGKSFMHGIGLIDSFSSPDSWRKVLDALGEGRENKLRLCLAHFGGKGFFSGEFRYDVGSPYSWMHKIVDLINDCEGIYTDISCFGFDSFVPLPEEITPGLYSSVRDKISGGFIDTVYRPETRYEKNNMVIIKYIYAPRGTHDAKNLALLRLYIILEYPNETDGLSYYKELYKTAQGLSALIERHSRLRHRVLFGTDWPMSEMKVKGVQRYNSAMFVLLQLVTVFRDNEWDAWHQFAVINPLRFLGLLEDPDDNLDGYRLDMGKIDKMREAIEDYLSGFADNEGERIKHWDLYGITTGNSKLNDQYERLEMIAEQVIPSADRMISADNRLLLTNMEKGSKHYHDRT